MAGEFSGMTPQQRELSRIMSQPPSPLPLPEEMVKPPLKPLLGQQVFPTPKAPAAPRDLALELFKFYVENQVGPKVPLKPKEVKPDPKKVDTKTVKTKDMGLTKAQKTLRAEQVRRGQRLPEASSIYERQEMLQRWRDLAKSPNFPKSGEYKPIAVEMAANRARQAAAAEIIRDAIHFAFGVPGGRTPQRGNEMMSREEQRYIDRLKQRAIDAQMELDAVVAEEKLREKIAKGEQPTSRLDEFKATRDADKRTLEGRQVAERVRLARQALEKSLLDQNRTNPRTEPRTQTPLKGGALGGVIGYGGGGLTDQIK